MLNLTEGIIVFKVLHFNAYMIFCTVNSHLGKQVTPRCVTLIQKMCLNGNYPVQGIVNVTHHYFQCLPL